MIRHPSGLGTLCFAEALERFSYYTMSGLLVLFLTGTPDKGGLGWPPQDAVAFFGTYTAAVWFTPLAGGFVADRLTGSRGAMIWGAVFLAAGQMLMCMPAVSKLAWSVNAFYAGLLLLALGNGLFKPNVTVVLGRLYGRAHPLREQGFTLFYVAINIGAVLSALVAGTVAERFGWAFGFGVASVAMLIGLVALMLPALRQSAIEELRVVPAPADTAANSSAASRGPILFIAAMAVFATLFWAAFLQMFGVLSVYIYDEVDRSIAGWTVPAAWFGSLTAAFIIIFGTYFSRLLARLTQSGWRIDTVSRFAAGLAFAAAGFAIVALVAAWPQPSFVWLISFYLLLTLGELCLSPAGNEMAQRFAPPHLAGRLMAVWMLCLAFGSLLSGQIGALADPKQPSPLFTAIAIVLAAAAVVLVAAGPRLRRMVA